MSLLTSLTICIYGFLASITYDLAARSTDSAPIIALPFFALIALILVAPFAKLRGVIHELQPKHILRSIIFAVSQCLVVLALSNKSTFSTFSSIALGTLIAISLGKFFLKEKISLVSTFGIATTFFGMSLLKRDFSIPHLALIAGILQGTGVFLARKRSVSGAKICDMAAANLFTLLVLSVPVAISLQTNTPSKTNWTYIILVGVGFATLQTAYSYLSRKIDSWLLSLIGNTRIPASILVAALLSTSAFSWKKMGVGLLIFSGIAISYVGMKTKNNKLPATS